MNCKIIFGKVSLSDLEDIKKLNFAFRLIRPSILCIEDYLTIIPSEDDRNKPNYLKSLEILSDHLSSLSIKRVLVISNIHELYFLKSTL